MLKKETSKPTVIILGLIIIFSFAFTLRQLGRIAHMSLIARYEAVIDAKVDQYHGALTDKNVDLIASWMTFDYINKIFALPADYLKNALAISDTGYPRVSVSKYAKVHKLDQAGFLAEVQKSVASYFTAH